jgi:pyruvate-ferredoxin/flavodoxin oxidoreductase
VIQCPTESKRVLFATAPLRAENDRPRQSVLLGPVQNQEHYMQGVVARRNNFTEPILEFLEDAYKDFGELTGRYYGLVTEYKTEDADTVFVSLGSAAENIEAGVDYLRARTGAPVGSIHLNVIRPFPEAAIIKALAGKKNVIILERTDEAMAGDNPMGRDIRTALNKAVQSEAGIPALTADRCRACSPASTAWDRAASVPSSTIGAYEIRHRSARAQDGKRASDGVSFMVLGVDHPRGGSRATRRRSCPSTRSRCASTRSAAGARSRPARTLARSSATSTISLRARQARRRIRQPEGNHPRQREPKYGSEKKGAPTAYFMVAAPKRIRVNCDLRHVTVVLCCDPKAFTAHQSARRMSEGGCLVWESEEEGEQAWGTAADGARKQIIDKKIRVFTLPGFQIARKATDRADLQPACRATRSSAPLQGCRRSSRNSGSIRTVPRGGAPARCQEVRPARRRRRQVEYGGLTQGLRARPRDQRR